MPNQRQAEESSPEKEITVDLGADDPAQAVERRARAKPVAHEEADEKPDPIEERLFKRMTRFQKNLTKQFDQKSAEREAEWQRERSELLEKIKGVALERESGATQTEYEAKMKGFEDSLAAANEKGDSVAAARITREMISYDGAYHAKQSGAAQRKDTKADSPREVQAQPQTARGPTPAGSRFILANEDWWEDPAYEVEKGAASTIYVNLLKDEGFDANSDETFAEVAKRLKAKFPKLPVLGGRKRVNDADEDQEPTGHESEGPRGNARRAPAMRVSDRGAGGARNTGNRRTLTEEEIKTMRSVQMDPDKDDHVLRFLREAQAMEAQR